MQYLSAAVMAEKWHVIEKMSRELILDTDIEKRL